MTSSRAARRPPARALLVRIDPKSRTSLQEQIYDGLRRAIVDGVLPPGARVPSSRELARGPRRLAHDDAARTGAAAGRGLPRRAPRARARSSRASCPTTGPTGVRRSPSRCAHPPLSRRGAAIAGRCRPPRRGRPPAVRSRSACPRSTCSRCELWARLASRRLGSVTAAELDYGKVAGYPPLREAIADYVAELARHTLHARAGARHDGRAVGAGARLHAAAGRGRPRLDGGAGLSRRAQRAHRGGRAHRARPGRRGRARRGGGRPQGARRAHGDRDALAPVPARRADEPGAAAGAARLGERRPGLGGRGRLRQRVPLRRAAPAVPARPRPGRPRDLRRQLREERCSRPCASAS